MGNVTLEVALNAVHDVVEYKGIAPDAVLGPETELQSLLFDSLDIAMLFSALEDRVGVALDPGPAPELERISDLTQLRAMGSKSKPASR
jgi:acyl carrier protein